MRKLVKHFMFAAVLLMGLTIGIAAVQAADNRVAVTNGESKTVDLVVGDTGRIVPPVPSVQVTTGAAIDDNGQEEETEELPVRYTYTLGESYYWDDEHCMTIDEEGNFKAVQPGSDYVEVKGYSADDQIVFQADVSFNVTLDMSKVSLKKTKITAYLFENSDLYGYGKYQAASVEIPIKSPYVLDEDTMDLNLSIKSSSKKVQVYGDVSDNKLCLTLYGKKKCTVTITVQMGGKTFNVQASMKPVKSFVNSYLLEKGKTKQLKLSGYSGKITWSSTNPKVASVSSSGVVKGKAIGNVVITAKVGDHRIGCAVSVTTAALKKVCARATYIGTHWTYSQAKRTKNGYYDCSALVWKAYHQYTKINFGTSYVGCTKSEAPWCRDKKKLMKGGFSTKKMEQMRMNPGDIVFKSSDPKHPYTTTTHVEMFTGYACTGYDYNGKPIVVDKWASRSSGYGYSFEKGSIWARPTK